jgi:hypothetical protein
VKRFLVSALLVLSVLLGCGPPPDAPSRVEGRGSPPPPVGASFVVLDFRDQASVFHGRAWRSGVDLGPFGTEGWVRPWANAGSTYWWRNGYGGDHSEMEGVISDGKHLYQYCMIYTGTGAVVVRGDDPIRPGDTFHAACSYDGSRLKVYRNGVMEGTVPYSGPRMSAGPSTGGGWAFAGSSDHSGWEGRISMIRSFQGQSPQWSGDRAFRPESVLGDELYNFSSWQRPQFLVHYTDADATIYDDLSDGYDEGLAGGPLLRHPGRAWNSEGGYWPWGGTRGSNGPLPEPVVDVSFPHGPVGSRVPPSLPPWTPPSTPPGALAFDSFSREDSTWAFDAIPSLGSTEAGTLGPLVWQSGGLGSFGGATSRWGSHSGRAVFLDSVPGVAWIEGGTSDAAVSVDRRIGSYNSGYRWTGVSFRVVDRNNLWFAWLGASGLMVGKVVGGTFVWQQTVPWPSPALDSCPTVKVRAVASSIEVYGCSTLLASISDATHQTATKWGVVHYGNSSRVPQSIVRYDNFTLLPP